MGVSSSKSTEIKAKSTSSSSNHELPDGPGILETGYVQVLELKAKQNQNDYKEFIQQDRYVVLPKITISNKEED